MTDPSIKQFYDERHKRIATYPDNKQLNDCSHQFLLDTTAADYEYNFDWMGRPIIQYPQDIVAIQELIWGVQPDLIIETGIAHGGSLCFSASMLALLDYSDAITDNKTLDPSKPKRRVLGIDIDIRAHNRKAIEAHPMANRIDMIEGSSVASNIIAEVSQIADNYRRIMVFLDSNHSHDHVLAELEAYAPLVSMDSYCVVLDTAIEDLPKGTFPNRPWDKGDNPKTAAWKYLTILQQEGRNGSDGEPLRLEIDHQIENKLLVSVAPNGYLKRII